MAYFNSSCFVPFLTTRTQHLLQEPQQCWPNRYLHKDPAQMGMLVSGKLKTCRSVLLFATAFT